jgi:hypothetical protein
LKLFRAVSYEAQANTDHDFDVKILSSYFNWLPGFNFINFKLAMLPINVYKVTKLKLATTKGQNVSKFGTEKVSEVLYWT